MTDQTTDLEWRDGIPISVRFDDPYYSLDNGLAETRHVFLDGNDLPARLTRAFHIAELGFGTGLNLLATMQLPRNHPLTFTSFEMYPLDKDAMAKALSGFADVDAAPLLDQWDAALDGPVALDALTKFHLIQGDARDTIAAWTGRADAWFLDGFSPAKNPALWEPALMQEVANHTVPQGTVATYTAAGFVRRALADAGFEVERTKGYGRKRHMTRARMP